MNAEITNVIAQSAKAEENRDAIIQAKLNVAANYLILARLLNENHRDSLYKLLGCDSFDEFLGMPEVGFKRSTAYNLIKVWKLYKEKLGIDDHTMLDIGHTKLLKIAPVVEQDKDEWLGKAKSLSVSDLTEEISGVSGARQLSPPIKSPAPPPLMACINGCGPGEKSHFPITRGAGGQEVEEWWVPMCRSCHDEFHRGADTFILNYKKNWARWYNTHLNRGE